MVCLTMNLTALGQPTSDSVTISRESQVKCIKYRKEVLRQELKIADLHVFIDSIADLSVNELDSQLQDCSSDLETMTDKRDRTRKVAITVGIVAAVEGVYIWIRETVFK